MKGPSRKEEIPPKNLRHDYSKETKNLPNTYDEAKASCKARKRKERQESVSSICQERKVIRSNSEERPIERKNGNIRRVSSTEDFQKVQNEDVVNSDILIYDDFEHEKRRSRERFSKPLTFKNKSKKPKTRFALKFKLKSPNDEEKDSKPELKFLQLHANSTTEVKDRSPSPSRNNPPNFDLKTLHEQVDCSEPLLSSATKEINENTETLPALSVASNRLLSSPRNSIIATHRIYLDPDIPQTKLTLDSKNQDPLALKLQKITKHVNSLKKKIRKYEEEFEENYGHKVSHADKLSDKNIRKLYVELSKLRKEQKQLMEICTVGDDIQQRDLYKEPKSLQDTLQEIEKKLIQKREVANRNCSLDHLSADELADEKTAVQKALLFLESIHGRPDSKDDRNLVRPIYDRYRQIKRMIAKSVSISSVDPLLATIHEDETMNFTSSFPPPTPTALDANLSSPGVADTSLGENVLKMSRAELVQQQRIVGEEKKQLHRQIKVFESDVQRKTGRMVLKDDKIVLENVYVAYKKAKAKLRLLDALVEKQL